MNENHFKNSWEETKLENRKMDMLTDQRIKSNIEKKLRNKRLYNVGVYSAIAAVLIGLIVSLFPIIDSKTPSDVTYYASNESSKRVELPDGSIVVLEPHSSLLLSEDFNEKERNVNFKGKGVFEIAKNKSKPFNIDATNFSVHVLGTKFYLNQTLGNEKVDLYEGKVKVSHKGKISYLIANESWKETRSLHEATETKQGISVLEIRRFSFDNEILDDIIKELEITYNVQITYPENYSKNRIKGSFEGNLEEVLLVIGYPFNLTPQKISEDHIKLK